MNACVDVTRPNQTTGYHTIAENYAKPHHTIAKLSLTTQGYFEFEININVLGSSNLVSSIVKTVDSDPRIDSYCCIVHAGHHGKAGNAIVFWPYAAAREIRVVFEVWEIMCVIPRIHGPCRMYSWLFWHDSLDCFCFSLTEKTAFVYWYLLVPVMSLPLPSNNSARMCMIPAIPANRKHLYNNCTMTDQRLRRWSDIVQMLYKYFVFYWDD